MRASAALRPKLTGKVVPVMDRRRAFILPHLRVILSCFDTIDLNDERARQENAKVKKTVSPPFAALPFISTINRIFHRQ